MMLGDMGADVLKIERPDGGDETRGWGPPFDTDGESAYYLSVNRNKLGVAANLDSEGDRAFLGRLIASADVVIENFMPGALARRGLGFDQVRSTNPGLVWCTITGFGAGSARPGYDFVVQAESGWMAITGEPGGEPMKHGIALADLLAGRDAAIAILAALVARGANGEGRLVDVSLARSAEAALVNVAQNVLVSGNQARRWGNAHANLVPYQLFHARDRAMVIAVGSDVQWIACARALGLDALAADATLATNAGRLAERTRVTAAIAGALEVDDAAHWLARLAAAAVPCGVVRSVDEVLASVNASALTGMPPSVPGSVRRPPPRLGEHTALVRERGWGAFEVVPIEPM